MSWQMKISTLPSPGPSKLFAINVWADIFNDHLIGSFILGHVLIPLLKFRSDQDSVPAVNPDLAGRLYCQLFDEIDDRPNQAWVW